MFVSQIFDEASEILATTDNNKVFRKLTQAVQTLMESGHYFHTTQEVDVCTGWDGQTITLPRGIEVPLGVNIDGSPTYFRGRLFQYHVNKGGMYNPVDWAWDDRGFVATVMDIRQPSQLVAVSEHSADAGGQIRVIGTDSQNRPLRSQMKDGTSVDGILVSIHSQSDFPLGSIEPDGVTIQTREIKIDPLTRFLSINPHQLKSGQSVVLSAGSGVVPNFIYAGTTYYVGVDDSNTIQLYKSQIDATSAYPTYVNSTYAGEPNDNSATLGYSITYPTISGNSISSIDGQYFDLGGGALIARADISRSLVTGSTYYTDDTATGLRLSTEALKARRLYFPTPVSQSGQSTGTDYWFKSFTGYKANDLFTDNGGIYNVQFTLKKQVALDSYPDNNTFMSVFIHNVIPQIPSSSARVPGALGWYPPENNIVRVGNGYGTAPAISFYDIQTGYTIEKFNINVIQYGYPAQLCIEASGSLADNAYFGIIVDDIQMCKVGVTTDPRFIKPYSLTQTVQNTSFVESIRAGIDRINPGEGTDNPV